MFWILKDGENNQKNGYGSDVTMELTSPCFCRFSFSGDDSVDFLMQGWVPTIFTIECLLFLSFNHPLSLKWRALYQFWPLLTNATQS